MRLLEVLLGALLLADGGSAGLHSELALRELGSDTTCQRLARAVGLDASAPASATSMRAVGWLHRSGSVEAPSGASVALTSEMGTSVESSPDARGTFFVTVDGKTAKLTVSAPGFEPASRSLTAGTYCIEASLAPSTGAR